MRTILWIGLGILVVVALVVTGLTAGWAVWGRQLWAAAPSYALGGGTTPQDCDWGYGRGPAMMRGGATPSGTARGLPCVNDAGPQSEISDPLTIAEAHEAVKRYLAYAGPGSYPNLRQARGLALILQTPRGLFNPSPAPLEKSSAAETG